MNAGLIICVGFAGLICISVATRYFRREPTERSVLWSFFLEELRESNGELEIDDEFFADYWHEIENAFRMKLIKARRDGDFIVLTGRGRKFLAIATPRV